jgi:iron complex outermembrane receptor protein
LNGYELGSRSLAGKNFYVDIAGFYNHYGDLFSEDLIAPPAVQTNPPPTHIQYPAQFGNGLVASTTGVEAVPEWHPTSWWRLGGSYSFLDMHVKKGTDSLDIGSAPVVQRSSPEHQALLKNGFDLPGSVSADIQVRFVSALTGIQVPSYWTGNAAARWTVNHHILLTAVGQNLFQPHHVEFVYDPGPAVGIRRGFYGQITLSK